MPLRVMTYNILNGGEGRETQILQVILVAKPDVIILQEVYSNEILNFLSQASGMKYFLGDGNQKRKVALLSRLPVREFKNDHPLFPISRNFVDAQIEIEPNKTLRVIGVHSVANLGVLFELWRLWEANFIIRHSRGYQDEFCLVAGDFNAIAPHDSIHLDTMPRWLNWILYLQGKRVYRFSIQAYLSAGYTDGFRFLNPTDYGYTLPTPNPNARLDYIFVNAKLKTHLKKCEVVSEPGDINQGSDHYPVVAEFSF